MNIKTKEDFGYMDRSKSHNLTIESPGLVNKKTLVFKKAVRPYEF
jgi:hypothetical protein